MMRHTQSAASRYATLVVLFWAVWMQSAWASRTTTEGEDPVTIQETLDISIVEEAVDAEAYFANPSSQAVAFDRNGRAHVVYGGDHLYHAYSDGSAWSTETVDASSGVGEYAALAIDTRGTADVLHIAYYDALNKTLKYARYDNGSWSVTSLTGGGGSLALALDSDGAVHISHASSSVAALQYTTNSTSDGSWQTTTLDSGNVATGSFSTLAVDDSDDLHIVYYHNRGSGRTGLSYATKALSDVSWTTSELYTGASYYSSLGVDSAGNLSLCFYASQLKYLTKAAGSATWSSAQTLDASRSTGSYCSLSVDGGDDIHVSYYDAYLGNLKYLKYTNAAGSWGSAQTLDSAGTVGRHTAVASDAGGTVLISYYDATNQGLKLAQYARGLWQTETLSLRSDVGAYASLALDSSGHAHISYYDTLHSDLKYATNASGNWETSTLVSAGYVGLYASLKIDADDHLHIAYFDSSDGDLKYATNRSGSWITSTVDGSADADVVVGHYSTLALDAAGRAHIAYNSENTSAEEAVLKYATNASGAWVSQTLTPSASAAGDTAIAVDAGGAVHISYAFSDWDSTSFLYVTNASGSWTLETPDRCATSAGHYSSLAVDASGVPHFAYYQSAGTAPRYLTYDTGLWECAYFTTTHDDGWYTSLVLDTDTYAYITYYDRTAGTLKFMTNAQGGQWNGAVLDASGNAGSYTTLVRDASDTFHVSYYDAANRDLKYARFTIANDTIWYADSDGDGYGDAGVSVVTWRQPSGYVNEASDCDDASGDVHPAADEVCGDAHDNNCNGSLNEGCAADSAWDDDGDGQSEEQGDCNDSNAAIFAGAPEVCDGLDNDCDGLLDAADADVVAASVWYTDADGDGYGADAAGYLACAQPAGHVALGGDCDDHNATTHPAADEVCDSLDNDCNGSADESPGCFLDQGVPTDTSGDEVGENEITPLPQGDTADHSLGMCALRRAPLAQESGTIAAPLGLLGLIFLAVQRAWLQRNS